MTLFNKKTTYPFECRNDNPLATFKAIAIRLRYETAFRPLTTASKRFPFFMRGYTTKLQMKRIKNYPLKKLSNSAVLNGNSLKINNRLLTEREVCMENYQIEGLTVGLIHPIVYSHASNNHLA